TAGSFIPSATADAIFSATAGGVPGGATRLDEVVETKPGQADDMTGTSGSAGLAVALPTASARSLPLRIRLMAELIAANIMLTWPPIRSASAGPLPLYGTWVRRISAIDPNISPVKWEVVP